MQNRKSTIKSNLGLIGCLDVPNIQEASKAGGDEGEDNNNRYLPSRAQLENAPTGEPHGITTLQDD